MSENGARPGIGRMVGALVRAPFEERLLREESARAERLQIEAANDMLSEAVRLVQPENDGYLPIGLDVRELDQADSLDLLTAARRAALRSTHMVGYLRSLQRFVMGTGPTFRAVTEDEQLNARLDAWWDLFTLYNDWDSLEDEIPLRTWRDGEAFIWPVVMEGGNLELSVAVQQMLTRSGVDATAFTYDIPEGMVLLRLIPPEDIADPHGNALASHGILTLPDDVRTVIAYLHAPDGKLKQVIPADDLMHIKIRVDSDVKRGRSLLEPLLKRDKQFDEWVNHRMALNYVRTAVALVKKVSGTPAQMQAMRDRQATTRPEPDNDRLQRRLKPGTSITTNADLQMLSPNIQAQDAQHDGRTLLLSMAAATGLPEYMFTGDSSNANYASTMVSESPAIREFESWQDFFRPKFEWIWRRVMQAALDASQIKGGPSGADELEVAIEFPTMLARDELNHTKANMIRADAGILSKEGWARDEGLDWEVERERLEQERQAAVEFTAPPQNGRTQGAVGEPEE